MKDNFKFRLSEKVLEATQYEGDGIFIYTANKEDDLYRVTWVDEDDDEENNEEDSEAFYTVEEVKICLTDNDWIIVENEA